MTKRLPVIAAVLAVIIIIAAAAVFTRSKTQTPSQEPIVSQQTEEESQETANKGSIKDLIGLGKNATCTITYPIGDGTAAGTVYITSDKRIRGDFTTNVEGKDIDSHMIAEGGWNYIWSSASLQGTKMKIDENASSPTPGLQSQNVDTNSQVDYKCSNWSVDNSKFVPPSNIQFLEIGMPTLQTPQSANTQDQSQQSVCDQITDPEAKAACQKAITDGN